MENKGMRQLSRAISLRITLPAICTLLLFFISLFTVTLPAVEERFMDGKREMIRELTQTAWNVLETYHQQEVNGALSREEAQMSAIRHIRNFRYGTDKSNYFWINDLAHRLIVHPYRPDMEGTDNSSFQDPEGKHIFVEFVKIAQTQEAGYVQYMWQWLDNPDKIVPKLSYIQLFKPWGWVIGTGVYLHEVKVQVAAIRARLLTISIIFFGLALLLAAYSIRYTVLADRVRVRIWDERAQLIKDLNQSKEKYRSLVETTSDWIWEVNNDGYFTYSSPNIRTMLGYKPEEIIGKTFNEICHPGEKSAGSMNFEQLLALEKPFSGFEVTCTTKNKNQVVLEINGVPACDINQTDNKIVYRGVARDITRRKAVMTELQESRDRLHESLEETVTSLSSAAEKRDPYTAGHQQRVDTLACAIAKKLGLSNKQIEGLHFAAILHDIGKISLPAEYLAKPSALSKEEQAIIKCHAEAGYEILKKIRFPWPVAEIVYQHHELLDGSGYPRGLHDEDILLEAKILTVADVVEAMSSHRPYRPSLGIEAAINEIRSGRGTKYHARSVDVCQHLITKKMVDFSSQTW